MNTLYELTASEQARFERHCYRDEEGILRWGGAIDESKGSYGVFKLRGKLVYAHRIAFDLWGNEPLTSSLLVRHTIHGIENKNIIDPRFLCLGTTADNMRDRNEAGRQAKGSKIGSSRLTEQQVLEIYSRVWSGENGQDLAINYNISGSVVSKIKLGKSWSWLTQPQAIAAD